MAIDTKQRPATLDRAGKPAPAGPRQRTIRGTCELAGVGLHTGVETRVRFKPAEVDSGVVFVRTDLPGCVRVPATIDHAVRAERRTTVRRGEGEVQTCEHILSALHGLSIDNVEIEIDGPEAPGADGSALPYFQALQQAGAVDQAAARVVHSIDEPVAVDHGGASVVAIPQESGLSISYTLNYDTRYLPPQHFTMKMDAESYGRDVAPARTFCLKAEAEALLAAGLGKGASTANTLVIGEEGVIDNTLRFPDEFVRHKVLDLIGDLKLLGAGLNAHIIAVKSGHELNAELVRRIKASIDMADRVRARREALAHELDVREIQRILPHRYPFLLIDRIVEIDQKRAVGLKNVTYNEQFFQGHFPGQPVMPGVLIIEAMAQLAGVLLLRTRENVNKLAYLLSLDDVKFRKTVGPGDQLVLEAVGVRVKERTGQVQTKASVGAKVVAEATMKFMLVSTGEA